MRDKYYPAVYPKERKYIAMCFKDELVTEGYKRQGVVGVLKNIKERSLILNIKEQLDE